MDKLTISGFELLIQSIR